MRASELISKLEEIIEKQGDLVVANEDGITIAFVDKSQSPYREYIELDSFGGWDVFEK